MTTNTPMLDDAAAEPVLRDCADTLKRVGQYRLPDPINQRLLWLSENKDQLCEEQHGELLALTEFAEQRTLEKVQAQAVLERLVGLYPHLVGNTS